MEPMTKKMKQHGIDTEGVIARLGGKEKLYLTICKKFLDDPSFSSIQEAISKGDYTKAKLHIHTLKGVAANLGFSYLHALCSHLLTELEQEALGSFYRDLIHLDQEYNIITSILKENA